MSDFTAKITAVLDARQAESELSALTSAKHQLDIQVNLKSGNTNINNFLNSLRSQAQSAGASAGSGFADSFNNSMGSIDTKIQSSGKKIIQTYNSVSAASKKMASSAQIAKFDAQITTWLNNNTKANNTFRSSVKALQERLNALSSAGQVPISTLRELQQQMGAFSAQARAAGVAGKSFGDTLKGAFSSIAKYVSVATLISNSVSTLKDMANNVLQVDTALTELYRVSNLSTAQYDKLYSKMTQSAKDYGTALSDIIDSTASWVRLGFDADTASNLAEITAMYQHVTDLDTGTAVNNLITAYKGFEEQLLQVNNGDSAAAIEMVADIYDKLGKVLPLTNYIG